MWGNRKGFMVKEGHENHPSSGFSCGWILKDSQSDSHKADENYLWALKFSWKSRSNEKNEKKADRIDSFWVWFIFIQLPRPIGWSQVLSSLPQSVPGSTLRIISPNYEKISQPYLQSLNNAIKTSHFDIDWNFLTLAIGYLWPPKCLIWD